VVLGLQLRVSCLLGKPLPFSHTPSPFAFKVFFQIGSSSFTQASLGPPSSSLCFPSSWIILWACITTLGHKSKIFKKQCYILDKPAYWFIQHVLLRDGWMYWFLLQFLINRILFHNKMRLPFHSLMVQRSFRKFILEQLIFAIDSLSFNKDSLCLGTQKVFLLIGKDRHIWRTSNSFMTLFSALMSVECLVPWDILAVSRNT
jgi:hypothetical protein